jgi:hypothetical protein
MGKCEELLNRGNGKMTKGCCQWCFNNGENGERLLNNDGGKWCGVAESGVSAMGRVKRSLNSGVLAMKKEQRVADSGVSAMKKEQRVADSGVSAMGKSKELMTMVFQQ